MRRKIIGIFVCMLMIANVLTVLVSSEETESAIEKTNLFVFEDTLNQKNGKCGFLDHKVKSGLPGGIFAGRNDNLAPNPSFEEGDTMPTGWTHGPSYPSDSKGIFHWDSDYARSGEKSVGLLNLTQSIENIYWETTEYIPVDFINYIYEFSAWYKFIGIPTESQHDLLMIMFYNESYYELGSMSQANLISSSEWLQVMIYPIDVTFFANAKYVKLNLGHFSADIPNPFAEVRFDDVYFGVGHNRPPDNPTITGPSDGKPGKDYEYTFLSADPDGEQIYYRVDWGDETGVEFFSDRYDSGHEAVVEHSWYMEGIYTIKAQTYDSWGVGSDWATFYG
jgi:hypothetical protein